MFVQKIVKIRQSFLKLQSIMSGSLFLRHSVQLCVMWLWFRIMW